ncbi:hypothetical protein BJ170DRAFT_681390 [Xylariales sp. AK1849]|nr:hypothetical protein BJ170DRAFT_681390 [Xylariales sp. AK1849]
MKPMLANLSASDPLRSQSYSDYFSAVEAERTRSASVVNLWLGKTCGTEEPPDCAVKVNPFIFAFHRKYYGPFMNILAAKVDEHKSFRIQRNPKVSQDSESFQYVSQQAYIRLNPNIFGYLMQVVINPLSAIRWARRVLMITVMGVNKIKAMVKVMVAPTASGREIICVLLSWKKDSDRFVDEGNYLEAMLCYWQGKDAPSSPYGGPEYKPLMSVEINISSSCAEAMDSLVNKRLVNGRIFGHTEGYFLDNSIVCADAALRWEGVTDAQRRLAKYHRGVALKEKAVYLTQHQQLREQPPSSSDRWPNTNECYEEAAKDLFSAKEFEVAAYNISTD